MNQISVSQKQFEIEERRRQVASLVAKSMTEREIAAQLNISQSTIHRDIEALREMSNQFVYDLAKGDLAFFYSQAMTGIDGATRGIWKMLDDPDNKEIDMKRLAAFKTLIDAHKVKFELINAGPSVMALRSMTERLERVERNETTQVPQ